MERKYQVFVSSTFEDLKEERQKVIYSLLQLDCIPSGMELFPAADEDQWSLIKEVINSCDYFILILGGRYGSTNKDGLGYTEMEYKYAIEIGKPICAFLHDSPNLLPKDKTEITEEGQQKYDQFRKFAQLKMCKFWGEESDLAAAVTLSMVSQLKKNPAPGWIKGDVKTKEHSELAVENSMLSEQLRKLRSDSLRNTQVYDEFGFAYPAIYNILLEALKDELDKTEPIKIRVLGVCFHKSFPLIKKFIEENCCSGKRIEVRLSKLKRDCEISQVLNKDWEDYYKTYDNSLNDLLNNIKKTKNADVSIKITKYEYMPNWHGILINKKDLLLSACVWDSNKRMTAGENHYIHYCKTQHELHEKKIIQFMRWFDYSRFSRGDVDDRQIVHFFKN